MGCQWEAFSARGGVGEMKWALLLTGEFWYGSLLVVKLGVGVGRCPENNSVIISRKGDGQVKKTSCGCDSCTEGRPCVPVFTPKPVVYASRACRYCSGATTELAPIEKALYWRRIGVEVTPVVGSKRRRFWCDPCEQVTS